MMASGERQLPVCLYRAAIRRPFGCRQRGRVSAPPKRRRGAILRADDGRLSAGTVPKYPVGELTVREARHGPPCTPTRRASEDLSDSAARRCGKPRWRVGLVWSGAASVKAAAPSISGFWDDAFPRPFFSKPLGRANLILARPNGGRIKRPGRRSGWRTANSAASSTGRPRELAWNRCRPTKGLPAER